MDDRRMLSRRRLLAAGAAAGAVAGLAPLIPGLAAGDAPAAPPVAKAKQVIWLHMVGGPSQMDLFDHKPAMQALFDKDLPDSVRMGQRLTTMTSGQKRFPVAPSKFAFKQHGQCGMWLSELLPNLAQCADRICWMRALTTEAINHEPAIAAIQTGSQLPGKPCIGSWISYGLGSLNPNLPPFVVMVATPKKPGGQQAISGRLWSAGFLPGEHAGVALRGAGDPILFIRNPAGVSDAMRRTTLDAITRLNGLAAGAHGDPETAVRSKQYEMAYRMQASVPELLDLAKEPQSVTDLYGEDARKPGSFANSVLMARRLVERGVRFVQVYLNGWDHHGSCGSNIPHMAANIDRPCYGLIQDLAAKGLLDSTLVVWGGEFGRTIYTQGKLTKDDYGRDHHPRCFTMWMCGGGAKGGAVHGETDDFSYNVVKDGMHLRDLHATVLHLLGIDHHRLSVRHQGLEARLTGVEPAHVVKALLA